MEIIFNDAVLKHDTGHHPESAKRLEAFGPIAQTPLQPADDDTLNLVHTREYLQYVKESSVHSTPLDIDTPISPASYNSSAVATAATIHASQTGGFALTRPPGHHAFADRATGFCLFNHIAIASQKLVNEGNRVAIFDFDGHHGDGTQSIFYDTDQVLFCSIHQYPTFPGTGYVDEIGTGAGKGYTVNFPLPPDSGDDIFMNAVEQLLSLILQFEPDVLAISAGFDAYVYDMLLQLRASTNFFYKTGKLLREHFNDVFAVLEGGYNVQTLPRCTYSFLAGMNGTAAPFPERETASRMQVWESYEARLHGLLAVINPYWKVN